MENQNLQENKMKANRKRKGTLFNFKEIVSFERGKETACREGNRPPLPFFVVVVEIQRRFGGCELMMLMNYGC